MLALALAFQLAVSTTPTAYLDFSATANAALVAQGYWHPTQGTIALNNVQVPAGAVLDLSGVTVHTSPSSSSAASLNGVGAQVKGGHLICDLPTSSISPNVNPALLPSAIATGIKCNSAGVIIDGVSLDNFGIGIQSVQPTNLPYAAGESIVTNCHITQPINIGIDWQGPSDCLISHCIVARPYGGVQNASGAWVGLGSYGIKFYGGGGYVESCHVWGGFNVGIEIGSPDAYATDLTIEGSWVTLLSLTAYRVKVSDAFLFYPNSGTTTTAIQFGDAGLDCSACNVTARIGPLGGYGYKAIATEVNSALGNTLTLDFMGPQMGPPLTPGAKDHWSVLASQPTVN